MAVAIFLETVCCWHLAAMCCSPSPCRAAAKHTPTLGGALCPSQQEHDPPGWHPSETAGCKQIIYLLSDPNTDVDPPALQGCRPCKMFSRKYQRMAEQFQECIFLDIVGDESTDTRVRAARPWSNAQASILLAQSLEECVVLQTPSS